MVLQVQQHILRLMISPGAGFKLRMVDYFWNFVAPNPFMAGLNGMVANQVYFASAQIF
jgi:hypothetical protein